MAKGEKKVDWIKAIAVGLVGLLVFGFAGFGIYKIVQHYQKPVEEQTEQKNDAESEKGPGADSKEYQLAIQMVEG